MVDLIEETFGELSHNWRQLLLSQFVNKKLFYKDGELFGIVMIHMDDETKIVNSATIRNEDFTFGMRKYIMKECKHMDKFIIQSIMKDSAIGRYAKYNEEHQCFYRGV